MTSSDERGTERFPLTCLDLQAEGLTMKDDRPARCCDSCHDDADHGWGDLMEFQMEDGRWVRVCCYVAADLDRYPM